MPRIFYSYKHQAFVKQCSCCLELTIGTKSIDESDEIISRFYSKATRAQNMADGFQSRCNGCNSSKRRELNVTRQMIEDIFDRQGGKCAICTKDISIEIGAPAKIHAHVDHDETTSKIRGLLCGNCNRGIGCLKHDTNTLQNAIRYLNKHSNVTPLRRRAI
jgi:hypothetical protein